MATSSPLGWAMSTEMATEPSATRWSGWTTASDPLNAHAAAWTRAFFSHRSRVAGALQATGALAIASALPLRHWPESSLVTLLTALGIVIVMASLRITIGSRLPPWSLQVDVGLGTAIVSMVAAASVTEHVDLANLYLLVTIFAVLYLPLRSALAHVAAAGAAYALVLGVGPNPTEPLVVAWFSVFGTAAVLGVVVLGLVSVLRVTAREDALTGLANRRLWDERLEEELERSRRSGAPLSVIAIDLDGFKAVNDAAGHDVGDRLLRELAGAWKAVIRGGGDVLARLGGDEFGLLSPGSDAIGVRSLARRFADALPHGISASIGVATWDGTENASDLLRRADRAMYQKKQLHRRTERSGLA